MSSTRPSKKRRGRNRLRVVDDLLDTTGANDAADLHVPPAAGGFKSKQQAKRNKNHNNKTTPAAAISKAPVNHFPALPTATARASTRPTARIRTASREAFSYASMARRALPLPADLGDWDGLAPEVVSLLVRSLPVSSWPTLALVSTMWASVVRSERQLHARNLYQASWRVSATELATRDLPSWEDAFVTRALFPSRLLGGLAADGSRSASRVVKKSMRGRLEDVCSLLARGIADLYASAETDPFARAHLRFSYGVIDSDAKFGLGVLLAFCLSNPGTVGVLGFAGDESDIAAAIRSNFRRALGKKPRSGTGSASSGSAAADSDDGGEGATVVAVFKNGSSIAVSPYAARGGRRSGRVPGHRLVLRDGFRTVEIGLRIDQSLSPRSRTSANHVPNALPYAWGAPRFAEADDEVAYLCDEGQRFVNHALPVAALSPAVNL